jgi:glucokinase
VKAALGVDIGGTKIAAGVVRADGELLSHAVVPTLAATGGVLDRALGLARDLVRTAPADVAACGVGTAGTVVDGVVTHATSALPGWAGNDLRSAFAAGLDLPVVVRNDVHAWALGETRFGTACADALVVTVGTGIGGAIVRDGVVEPGRTGMAGSIGHIPVFGDRPCPCGRVGHLEAYVSGPALLSIGGVRDLCDVPDSLVFEAARLFGRALGGLLTVLDTSALILGGGVITTLGDRFLRPVAHAVREEALPGPSTTRVLPAALGSAGGVIGAAAAAL